MTERPDLEAYEALLTAATPGPWGVHQGGSCPCRMVWSDDAPVVYALANTDESFTLGEGYTVEQAKDNARLIAAAPTALRSLLTYARALEQDRAIIDTERANYRTEINMWLRTVQEQNAKIAALEQERDAARNDLLTLNRSFARLRAIVLAALDGLQHRYDALPEGEDAAAERMRQIVDERVRREERLIDEVNTVAKERDAAQARHDAEIAGIVEGLRTGAARDSAYARQYADHEAASATWPATKTATAHAARAVALSEAADSIATTHAAALARHAGRNTGGSNG